jgi:hypothetical protein
MVKGNGIIDSGRKLIFGGEAIVWGKHAEAMQRKESSDGTMRLRRAGKVSATMKIEKHGIARRWAFEAFAGDTAEVRGRNSDCGRNLVGIGVKDLARDTKVPHAFQTALDAPFHNPDRKPCLKACRHSLPPNLEF